MPAKGSKLQPDGTWLVPDQAEDAAEQELLAQEEPEPLCPQCFPDGWPADATNAGCAHGQWFREVPEADGE